MVAAANRRWPSIGELWTFLGIALPFLAALLVPMPSVDLAYQLRAGAGILAGQGIPAVDTWTFTVAGNPWLDQQWGAQVLLAAVYQAGGWTGLAILRATLVAAAFAGVLAALRSSWSIASVRAGGSSIASSARTATLIVLGSFAVAAPALALRPQLFAIVLFAATLLILVDRSRHPRRLWLIPVFAAAWANLHGSFPLVVVLVALAWVDEVALLRMPVPAGHARAPLSRRLLGSTGLALIGAISALATLLSPFGIDAWKYIENLARNPEITSAVTEWRPPTPLEPAGAVFYLSLLIVLGIVAYRLRSDRGRPGAQFMGPTLSIVVFGVLGVVTGRGLAWWAIAGFVAGVSLQPGLRLADLRLPRMPVLRARTAREASESETRRSPLNALVVVVLATAAVAVLPLWRPVGPVGIPSATLSFAPQGIVEKLNFLVGVGSLGRDARIWNPQTWGSWLEFGVPEARFAIDSRIELFPSKVIAENESITRGSADVLDVLRSYHVDAVVTTRGLDSSSYRSLTPVDDLWTALYNSGEWTEVYQDVDGTIWMRTAAPFGE
ncbi:MAG: hypothetical protein HYX55_09015 [Chloroflexi bacterium]|nr:hypothetical protein [Chloroflexota bacterium]